jgi:hypothetical protein
MHIVCLRLNTGAVLVFRVCFIAIRSVKHQFKENTLVSRYMFAMSSPSSGEQQSVDGAYDVMKLAECRR